MRLIVILFCFCGLYAFSQDGSNPEESQDTVYQMFEVAEPAVFPGGEDGLQEFLKENLQYPDSALIHETQGVVVLQFVVDAKGHVNALKVLTPPRGDGLEEEAMRVIALTSGMWKPAKQRGKPVSVKYQIPINFKLY